MLVATFFVLKKSSVLRYVFTMKDKNKMPVVMSLRLSEELDSELTKISDNVELAKQDLIRLCLRIGLKHLEAVKYDLAKCVLDKSLKK